MAEGGRSKKIAYNKRLFEGSMTSRVNGFLNSTRHAESRTGMSINQQVLPLTTLADIYSTSL